MMKSNANEIGLYAKMAAESYIYRELIIDNNLDDKEIVVIEDLTKNKSIKVIAKTSDYDVKEEPRPIGSGIEDTKSENKSSNE